MPVDARIEKGRTLTHAVRRLWEAERFDRIVAPAPAGRPGRLHREDLAWLLTHAPTRRWCSRRSLALRLPLRAPLWAVGPSSQAEPSELRRPPIEPVARPIDEGRLSSVRVAQCAPSELPGTDRPEGAGAAPSCASAERCRSALRWNRGAQAPQAPARPRRAGALLRRLRRDRLLDLLRARDRRALRARADAGRAARRGRRLPPRRALLRRGHGGDPRDGGAATFVRRASNDLPASSRAGCSSSTT